MRLLFLLFLALSRTGYADTNSNNCENTEFVAKKVSDLLAEQESKGLDTRKAKARLKQLMDENPDCRLQQYRAIVQNPGNGSGSAVSRPGYCSDISQRAKMPPIRSQGTTGWCFAYAAADLISFQLKKDVSAVSIAANFKNDKIFGFFDRLKGNEFGKSGFMHQAILASKAGVCLETEAPSDLTQENSEYIRLILDTASPPQGSCENQSEPQPESFTERVMSYGKVLFFGDPAARGAEVALQARCKTVVPVPFRPVVTDSPEALAKLNEALSNGEIVGASIDPGFWAEGVNYKGHDFSHAVTVVGRQWNAEKGRCEYQVRNNGHDESKSKYNAIYRSDGHYTWVPEETLKSNLESVVSF